MTLLSQPPKKLQKKLKGLKTLSTVVCYSLVINKSLDNQPVRSSNNNQI